MTENPVKVRHVEVDPDAPDHLAVTFVKTSDGAPDAEDIAAAVLEYFLDEVPAASERWPPLRPGDGGS